MALPVPVALREVTKYGALGNSENSPPAIERGKGRNAPVSTVRSVFAISIALCTTPIPLCTSSMVCPGNAPQGAPAARKLKPVQALIAMVP